ncbi:MAG: DUF445 domain-containing protein [Salinivenus sp.]
MDSSSTSAPPADSRSVDASDSDSSALAPRAPWTRLRRRLSVTLSRHLPTPGGGAPSVDPPPEQTGGYARWLPLLRALPWILGGLFALSFAWDFPGTTLSVAGVTIGLDHLLRYVTVSGLIGFGTNWLAITMLFRPREPRPIWGQGLVPAQRERVAYRLAQAVSDELINKRIIMQKVRESGLVARYRDLLVGVAGDVAMDEDVRHDLKAVLRELLRDLLSAPDVQDRIASFTAEQMERHADGLSGVALRTYRLFREDDFQDQLRAAVERLPEAAAPLLDELDPALDRVPAALERHGDALEDVLTELILRLVDTLDVERIVFENVRAYDEEQLELLLRRTTNEQLNYIKYLGAALGMIGGLIIWAPLGALTAVTALGLTLYAVDEVLYRTRPSAPSAS